jgi:hypothetical protein
MSLTVTNYTDELLKLPFVKDARAILPRNDKFKWDARDPVTLRGLCLHQGLDDNASAMGTAKYDCGPNHIDKDGLPGLSYTGFVERDGVLWLAWGVDVKTWSQGYADRPGDENEEFMAICFGGNFSGQGYQGTQEPSSEQMATAHQLWEACQKIWGWKNNQLYGHYHFGKPACPGFTLTDLIETYNADKDWIDSKYDLDEIEGRQQALQDTGFYHGAIDGVWSLECRFSLTEFQKGAGLNPDGVWGPKTNAAILIALG